MREVVEADVDVAFVEEEELADFELLVIQPRP